MDQPWKTIGHAVTKVEPGTQIFVRGGDYLESVIIQKSGKAGQPIRLAAYEQEKVIIDGKENPAIEAHGSYWIMDGLQLASSADRVFKLNSQYWRIHSNVIRGSVYIWGDHNILENNEIDGSRHLGNENGIMEDGEQKFQ